MYIRLRCGRLKERDQLKNLGADGRIMLKESSKDRMGGVDGINQAQDRDKMQAGCTRE